MAWDWQHESAARRSDAYGAGLRDGEAAGKDGRPFASCDPADWDERYAANYRNGWEHAYLAATAAERAELQARIDAELRERAYNEAHYLNDASVFWPDSIPV